MSTKTGSKSASKSSSQVHPQVSHHNPLNKPERLMLRLPEVKKKTGRGKTMHYDDIRRGVMTPGVAIGPRARAWPSDELDQIIVARTAGGSDAEIRELVKRLVAERRSAAPLALSKN
jgi:prophage regulatory protein